MITHPTDPAPRSYAPSVTLLRRAAHGPASAPAATGLDDVAAWLLAEAIDEQDLLVLFESFVWRLVAAGLPLDRASLHVGTLHPQLIGFGWNWNRADGLCDEVKVAEAVLRTDAYRLNPLFGVIENGEAYRADPRDPQTREQYPLMAELAEQGMTEYLAVPMRASRRYHNAATAATKQEHGFSDAERADLDRLTRLFALHVERHIAQRIARNLVETYLGADAGARVLGGAIARGAGEPIDAIIWASDLRGFTDLADRLDGAATLALLNAYFERLANAVMEHRGEVLKFIGDGLLGVFPYAAFADRREAAGAALAAAEQAMAAIGALNDAPPPELAAIDGWRPLRTGIALHAGEVFFGNVGAPARLDFTVIGRAVNAAARVEAFTKTLGRSILVTGPVAALIARPLDHLGDHALRGLAAPVSIFSPCEAAAPE